jgi:diadenosine tetraphosphate (Ap4A) HIT family hydrolase
MLILLYSLRGDNCCVLMPIGRLVVWLSHFMIASTSLPGRTILFQSHPYFVTAFYTTTIRRSPRVLSHRSMASTDAILEPGDASFGRFRIPAASIFFRSEKKSVAFVNLRPIVPGHVLVIPERIVPKIRDLPEDEYIDLWLTTRKVQEALTAHYGCTAFNVAIQDGREAGQSVPHVHVHILPRVEGDLERNDEIYDSLQEWAPRQELKKTVQSLEVPEDGDRRDRTAQEMADEAALYRNSF